MNNFYISNHVEVPFHYRNVCWFCGEPANKLFTFPHSGHIVVDCPHPKMTIPTCSECRGFALKSDADSIWLVKSQVKKSLIKTYQKHLAIGINWTKEELANAEFEGGNFESFQRSAWFMFEVAKARVNFSGWPLVIDGVYVDEINVKESFMFDGVEYPDVDHAISYYQNHYSLPKDYLEQVVASIGSDKFAKAVSFSRVMVGSTPAERKQALKQLVLTLADK